MTWLIPITALVIVSLIGQGASRPSEKDLKQLENDLNGAIEINGEMYVRKNEKKEIKPAPTPMKDPKKTGNEEEQNDLLDLQSQEKKKEKEKEEESQDGGEKVVEGDIIVDAYIQSLRNGNSNTGKRNILKETGKWSHQKYYYQLDASLTPEMRKEIRTAIKIMGKVSCIDYIEKKDPGGYVLFKKSPVNSCNSNVGKTGETPQTINVATWCKSGKIQHEIMHSLGFLHEQSRADRDDYVTIKWENIKEGMENQFEKYKHKIVETFKEPYDYKSIMHYSRKAFSKNGKDTVVPKAWFVNNLGVQTHLSDSDKTLLNRYYGCVPCKNTGWGCAVRAISFDSCERGKSTCLGSCGMYCKP